MHVLHHSRALLAARRLVIAGQVWAAGRDAAAQTN